MDRLQDVERLEAGDRDGTLIVGRDELEGARSHDGRDVSRADEAVQAQVRDSSSAFSGGTIVTWLHTHEKLGTPSAFARFSVSAVDGAVVSNPIAKKITSRSGFCFAIRSASSGE